MENAFWTAFGSSLVAAAVTVTGIFSIRYFESWARKYNIYFICFAAGVLISVSFLHIIPKSFEMTSDAPVWLLSGFLLLHLFNRFITAFVCEQGRDSSYDIGLISMIGIGFHSFIDGAVYSITFSVSTFTGIMAAIGMVLHEFPEGIITYVLLLQGGFGERNSALLAFFAASLSTPLGTLVSFPYINRIDQNILGTLLSLSAGALVYVGATHLLPQAEKEQRKFSLFALAAGILVAVIIVFSK